MLVKVVSAAMELISHVSVDVSIALYVSESPVQVASCSQLLPGGQKVLLAGASLFEFPNARLRGSLLGFLALVGEMATEIELTLQEPPSPGAPGFGSF